MNTEELLWLTSTAPQVLAALIGLCFAAMTFKLGFLDNIIRLDETQREIQEEVKRLIFSTFKILVISSLVTIVIDLAVIKWADWVMMCPLRQTLMMIIWGILNVFSLIMTCAFSVKICDPNYQKVAANNLLKSYGVGSADSMDFIKAFRDFEFALRERFPSQGTPYSMGQMIRMLGKEELLDRDGVGELLSINRLRNIILHEDDVPSIDPALIEKLKEYTARVKASGKIE